MNDANIKHALRQLGYSVMPNGTIWYSCEHVADITNGEIIWRSNDAQHLHEVLVGMNATARPYGCTVEYKSFGHGRGFTLWAGPGAWGLGREQAEAEQALIEILEGNPQVQGFARPRGGISSAY